jgi:ectoine hydroxylase-related dioxygenase (phytanoyl-CoA dioxygenase family)
MNTTDDFSLNGWLVLRRALDPDHITALTHAVEEVSSWAVTGARGLHHFEQTADGAVLARSEDFVDDQAELQGLIREGIVIEVLASLFGEPAVLFKEKINYKHPGGGGFAPHQDATAYRFVDHHISCMVPFDPATEASGCLFVAPGYEAGRLPTDERGRISQPIAESLDWRPVPLAPGDLLFFDSHTPHYSDSNTTTHSRRAAYLTYNAASLGDHRASYYDDKRQEFAAADATFDGDRVRLSITDDFLGRPAAPSAPVAPGDRR